MSECESNSNKRNEMRELLFSSVLLGLLILTML